MKVLSGGALARKIRDVCKGAGPHRCAVAFWGKDMPDLLFPGRIGDVEIILDTAMGGTTRAALTALGVPKAQNVRVIEGLHTKLYIGPRGAVIASANASVNALGRDFAGGRLEEIGVWIDAVRDKAAYDKAGREFARLQKRSRKALPRDLERAPIGEPRFMSWIRRRGNRNSLIGEVHSRPQDFGNVLFIFADQVATRDERQAAKAEYEEQTAELAAMSGSDAIALKRTMVAFYGPNDRTDLCTAALAVMYWGVGDRFAIYAYSDLVRVPVERGDVCGTAYFGRRNWATFRKLAGLLGDVGIEAAQKTDLRLARALAGTETKGKRWAEYTAVELAERVASIDGVSAG
jgi:hypothetical protein